MENTSYVAGSDKYGQVIPERDLSDEEDRFSDEEESPRGDFDFVVLCVDMTEFENEEDGKSGEKR